MSMQSRFHGAVIGSALGDAIGEIVLYKARRGSISEDQLNTVITRRSLTRFIREFPEYKYTDDTAMAIGIAECLVAKHGIDPHYLGQRFHYNYNEESWRGYGPSEGNIFLSVQLHGMSYVDAARKVGEVMHPGEGSMGDGAAMRAVPLGVFYHDSLSYVVAEASGTVTHHHPVGIEGAAVVAKAVALAANLDPQERFPTASFLNELTSFAKTAEMRQKLTQVLALINRRATDAEAADLLGRTVLAHDAVSFAVHSFVTNPKSYKNCLYAAILNGGDCDTIGAMACGMSGAYLGIDAIPSKWLARLENRDYLTDLAQMMFDIKTTGSSPKEESYRHKWNEQNLHINDEILEELKPMTDQQDP